MTTTVSGSAAPTVPASMFDDAYRFTEPALRAALDRLDSQTRLVCGYHLGLWDADGGPGAGRGKGLRPALAILSARAAGAPAERAVPAAVACELVHNFSLLHDDVMDGDTTRRHRPTAWVRFGVPAAILAGDAMLSLANEILVQAPEQTVAWAVRCLNTTTRRLIQGQAADLAFESRHTVSVDECLQMAGDKTGALLACSASLGAVLVDAPGKLALGLAEYGEHLGLAFQLNDDLLGIWGSPDRTGKSVWSDLRSRKKSVPVVAALTSDTPAGEQLRRLYAHDAAMSEQELAQAAVLVEEAGGRAWTEQRADAESAAAVQALDGLDLPSTVREHLAALIRLMSGRDH
ncbi:MAG TPA: polyprenyl synthetase family protein [Nocardioidaceae bacterium]|nr:polyprenyl synthetase family protein [Nocardioidaceae bacterium]